MKSQTALRLLEARRTVALWIDRALEVHLPLDLVYGFHTAYAARLYRAATVDYVPVEEGRQRSSFLIRAYNNKAPRNRLATARLR